ncbi:MAG: class I SAM-dependent methyltransferase [Acidimicrobiia bacterium]|nr:class I SAM-dependent methyltransferase [Acidimicrobiia bacterium]
MASQGEEVHGEADFVDRYPGGRILDAGCGMGRVGLELARRGYEVVGVDNDDDMLDRARAKDAEATWVLGDLTSIRFDRPFDTIVLAGNTLLFVDPPRRHLVVPNLAEALVDGGHLICGSSYSPPYDLRGYDEWCHHAGLELIERYGTWERDPYREDRNYAVSVHRARPLSERTD